MFTLGGIKPWNLPSVLREICLRNCKFWQDTKGLLPNQVVGLVVVQKDSIGIKGYRWFFVHVPASFTPAHEMY
jgi:hypothetical protein